MQPFERPDVYQTRRTTDRVTFALLREYIAALGARPFDADFYDPAAGAVLVRYVHQLAGQCFEVSLTDTQESRATARPIQHDARRPGAT